MNKYRSHNCSELKKLILGKNATLSGWIHRKSEITEICFL